MIFSNRIMKEYLLIPVFLFILIGCQQTSNEILNDVLKNNELVVVTRNAPTTYYNWHDEYTGLEYDMTQTFAESLGVSVKYLVKNSTSEILAAIEKGEAHIAAAGLTRTDTRRNSFYLARHTSMWSSR